MRVRAVCLPAATVLLLSVAPTWLSADPPHNLTEAVGQIFPIPPGDTSCPGATDRLFFCDNPGAYLVIDKGRGRLNNRPGYVTVRGEADRNSCAPFTLIHVRRIAIWDSPPPPCP